MDELPALRTDLADQTAVRASIPAEIRALLGPAPITHLEDGDAYERVLSKMAEAVAPTDFVEWILLKDIVDLVWEAARARRAKAVRLALARRQAIENILHADRDPGMATMDYLGEEISRAAYRVHLAIGDDENHSADDEDDDDLVDNRDRTFDDALARLGLTEDAINDAAYLVSLDTIERLQRLIDNANARRDVILREIDRRRDALGRRMREALASSDEIVDAEFDNVPEPG